MIIIGSWICAAVAVMMVGVETWAARGGRLRRSRAWAWAVGAVFWAVVAVVWPIIRAG